MTFAETIFVKSKNGPGESDGQRSNFERRVADFYPTPQAAVLPLSFTFAVSAALPSRVPATGRCCRHLEKWPASAPIDRCLLERPPLLAKIQARV